MPFLRRRGNMASETDIRRHTLGVPAVKNIPQPNLNDKPLNSDAARSPDSKAAAPPDQLPLAGQQSANGSPLRPDTPPVQDETPRHKRFSALRFRNASDSHLSLRAKQQAEKPPPVPPPPPEIITTAPTMDMAPVQKKPSRLRLGSRIRRSAEPPKASRTTGTEGHKTGRVMSGDGAAEPKEKRLAPSFQESRRPPSSSANSLPAYGDNDETVLALPANRVSESSRSDASSGGLYASTTTTTHTVHTTTTLFRLPRRKHKTPEPLFPLGHLPQKSKSRVRMSEDIPETPFQIRPSPLGGTSNAETVASGPGTPRPSSNHSRMTSRQSPSADSFAKQYKSPATALFRPGSNHSGQSSPIRGPGRLRGRSSTMSSVGRDSVDDFLAAPTTRTSSSTGRKSLGDLFSLSRLRQTSDLALSRHSGLTPATPGSSTSKNNSLQLVREEVTLPERRDDDTPTKYLARLEEVISRGVIASALSRGNDPFSAAVLRSYMRSFSFFGDPIDISLRKLLMEAELPKETQQIDRCLVSFANRYHECNPGVYSGPDQAYFVTFSLLILHTDVFNKNNKHKMQKADYLKNTRGEGIFDDILECFFDNITYTPFIHVEDDLDINGERIVAHKTKRKTMFPGTPSEALKRGLKEPLDPYALILDGKLDVLRPSLKDVMHLEDHYTYLGTAKRLDLNELQKTFFKTGILQIVSARSRPDAFMTERTASNPDDAHPGIVDIKITKVGLLWRKDTKKKKTRSPWQEWGAILTGAQLYFFRNTAWVKNLIQQHESHIKQGNDGMPVIFKPPLEQFKPDALISTDGAVALLDSAYKKHKHAFVYVRHGGFEEVLLADDEDEMNDWLAKLNYAAAFRTSGVRMRGVVGGNYEGQSRRGMRRLDSSDATHLIQTPTGEVSIVRGRIDHKMAEDILAARREIMLQKVADAAEKVTEAESQLEVQLRNARHLQVLAPIQPKTREQLLLSAARLSAQIKWTRMEIWKLRCHRDILLQDLDEERELMKPSSPKSKHGHDGAEAPTILERMSSTTGKSLRATSSTSVGPKQPLDGIDTESPAIETFQTPPTSAAQSYQRSDCASLRKASTSSSHASSSSPALAVSPGRTAQILDGGTKSQSPSQTRVEIDAAEQSLLEEVGLLQPGPRRNGEGSAPSAAFDAAEGGDWRDQATLADRLERNKLRRSLQRTLREGAGHLSHHRSKRGKDPPAALASEEKEQDDMLTRGAGSFVVHGKKASVIKFGSELQNMPPDDNIRQRQHLRREDTPLSPLNAEEDDFQSALGDPSEYRERRESATSASTATALSFRELHRKYSSAQASKCAVVGGKLGVPSDGESEIAVSFSDGCHTPLPPIDYESGDDSDTQQQEMPT